MRVHSGAHYPRGAAPAAVAAVAAVMAAAGRKQVAGTGAPAPQQAIDTVKADVAEIKEAVHR